MYVHISLNTKNRYMYILYVSFVLTLVLLLVSVICGQGVLYSFLVLGPLKTRIQYCCDFCITCGCEYYHKEYFSAPKFVILP
jgi:hypothetical protein